MRQNNRYNYPAYIGLEVHKEAIAVSVARDGREDPEPLGQIVNRPQSVKKLVTRLSERFQCEALLFCYQTGPCKHVLYKQLTGLGHH